MEEVLASLTDDDIRQIMVGPDLDWENVLDQSKFVKAAVHCCLNGPVGVKKLTTFPSFDGELKIVDLYDGRFSNKMWRNFCKQIAENLVENRPDLVEESQQNRIHQEIWPLYLED